MFACICVAVNFSVMASNRIKSLFERQLHRQNVHDDSIARDSIFVPTKAVKAELLDHHRRQLTIPSIPAEAQFDYIILDDEGYVVDTSNDRIHSQPSHSQPAVPEYDFIILDEIQIENKTGNV